MFIKFFAFILIVHYVLCHFQRLSRLASTKTMKKKISLDFSTAFDTHNYNLLMWALQLIVWHWKHGVKWSKSYLAKKKQFVKGYSYFFHSLHYVWCFTEFLLGPITFTTYLSPSGSILNSSNLAYQQYAESNLSL